MSSNRTTVAMVLVLAFMGSNCQSQTDNPGSPNDMGTHGETGQPGEAVEQKIQLKPVSSSPLQAGNVTYRFQLIEPLNNTSITDKDLLIDSEKALHFFLFDPALIEFRHLHPVFNGTHWSVDTDLSVSGNYWVWAEGKLASNQSNFFTSARQIIQGGTSENPVLQLEEIRTGNNSGSIATLSENKIQAKQMSMLTLTLSRQDGAQPQLSDYLGNKAHIVAVSADGSNLIHLHPMATPVPNQMTIHAEFPNSGKYRIWIQFIDEGSLKVVPLAVSVVD